MRERRGAAGCGYVSFVFAAAGTLLIIAGSMGMTICCVVPLGGEEADVLSSGGLSMGSNSWPQYGMVKSSPLSARFGRHH